MIQGLRMKNPAHPGGFIKSEIIEALELSVTRAADVSWRDPRSAIRTAQ